MVYLFQTLVKASMSTSSQPAQTLDFYYGFLRYTTNPKLLTHHCSIDLCWMEFLVCAQTTELLWDDVVTVFLSSEFVLLDSSKVFTAAC